MFQRKAESLTEHPGPPEKKRLLSFFSRSPLDDDLPALIHFSSTPLFKLDTCPDKYAHLLREKDAVHIGPLVNYFICHSGHVIYLGGEVVKNLYLHGRRKRYKSLTLLAIVSGSDLEKYSCIMNNIISSNDGAFSLGWKYRVRKNRSDGCFRDVSLARYVVEPRLEGPEKLLYPFRPASIELDLTTPQKFSHAFGVGRE